MIITKGTEISREIIGLDMSICELAYSDLDSNWHSENGIAGFSRIYYVESGEGVITYRGKTLSLNKDNIYIIPPGLSYSYSCSRNLKKLYCHFNILKADRSDIFSGIKECMVLKDRSKRINKAIGLWKTGGALQALELKTMVMQDCISALKDLNVELKMSQKYSPTVIEAMKLIDASPKMTITAETLSRQLLISQSSIRKIFRSEVGVPIGRYVTERVLFAAEQLLRSDLSIKEISERLGFCDRFYFSRVFTKKYGVSPAKYRIISVP